MGGAGDVLSGEDDVGVVVEDEDDGYALAETGPTTLTQFACGGADSFCTEPDSS